MSSLTLSLTIDRTSLSLSALELNDGTFASIMHKSFGPGKRMYRRTTVESEYMNGRILVAAPLATDSLSFGCYVFGSSAGDISGMNTNIQTLVTALSQFSYTMTAKINGTTIGQWTCEPADITVGGFQRRTAGGGGDSAFNDLMLKANPPRQEVFCIVPRNPITLAGPI